MGGDRNAAPLVHPSCLLYVNPAYIAEVLVEQFRRDCENTVLVQFDRSSAGVPITLRVSLACIGVGGHPVRIAKHYVFWAFRIPHDAEDSVSVTRP